jgi:hypothetical protein
LSTFLSFWVPRRLKTVLSWHDSRVVRWAEKYRNAQYPYGHHNLALADTVIRYAVQHPPDRNEAPNRMCGHAAIHHRMCLRECMSRGAMVYPISLGILIGSSSSSAWFCGKTHNEANGTAHGSYASYASRLCMKCISFVKTVNGRLRICESRIEAKGILRNIGCAFALRLRSSFSSARGAAAGR